MHIPDSLALIEKVRRMESRLEELDAMLNLAVEQLVQWNIGDELKKIILAALRDEHGGS